LVDVGGVIRLEKCTDGEAEFGGTLARITENVFRVRRNMEHNPARIAQAHNGAAMKLRSTKRMLALTCSCAEPWNHGRQKRRRQT
jgi:hypothetical protein